MLQLVALRAHPLVLAFARVADLRLQLAARCAEQVRFVLDIRLGDEAFARERHVVQQHLSHGFHDGDGLR